MQAYNQNSEFIDDIKKITDNATELRRIKYDEELIIVINELKNAITINAQKGNRKCIYQCKHFTISYDNLISKIRSLHILDGATIVKGNSYVEQFQFISLKPKIDNNKYNFSVIVTW